MTRDERKAKTLRVLEDLRSGTGDRAALVDQLETLHRWSPPGWMDAAECVICGASQNFGGGIQHPDCPVAVALGREIT